MTRWDVCYGENSCYLQPHFCRDYDCFGSNEDHGFSFEEAKTYVVEFYQQKLIEAQNLTEKDY